MVTVWLAKAQGKVGRIWGDFKGAARELGCDLHGYMQYNHPLNCKCLVFEWMLYLNAKNDRLGVIVIEQWIEHYLTCMWLTKIWSLIFYMVPWAWSDSWVQSQELHWCDTTTTTPYPRLSPLQKKMAGLLAKTKRLKRWTKRPPCFPIFFGYQESFSEFIELRWNLGICSLQVV